MHWLKELKAKARFKEPLSAHTTLGIGGLAEAWVEPGNFGQLAAVVRHCFKEKIPSLIIGKGSNLLFSDKGFKGVVISLSSPDFSKIQVKGTRISCGAGLSLNRLIRQAQKKGLGGVEFLAGIPSTVAGALIMNAGSPNEGIGSLIRSVTVMDKRGRSRLLTKKQLKFSYRNSNLDKYIVLETVFGLSKRSPKRIRENIDVYLAQKRKTQDLGAKSAGCVFKNPDNGLTAAEMIEACGLKGSRRGGAQISKRHANYIINRNKASARDVLYLMRLAQRRVKQKFGICLKPEIKIIR